MIVKTNAKELILTKIGITVSPEFSYNYQKILNFQLSSDHKIEHSSLLFFGDSLTQGLCVSCVDEYSVNYGIGNDTVVGLLNRLFRYDSIYTAKAVFITAGINDLLVRNPDVIIKDYEALIESFSGVSHLILISIFPIDADLAEFESRKNENINRLNKYLKNKCIQVKNCIFMDINSLMKNHFGNLKKEYHIGDGLHLSPLGYMIWIQELKLILKQL